MISIIIINYKTPALITRCIESIEDCNFKDLEVIIIDNNCQDSSEELITKQFPKIKLFSIHDVFGGWAKAQKTHFVNGAVFDQIYADRP